MVRKLLKLFNRLSELQLWKALLLMLVTLLKSPKEVKLLAPSNMLSGITVKLLKLPTLFSALHL